LRADTTFVNLHPNSASRFTADPGGSAAITAISLLRQLVSTQHLISIFNRRSMFGICRKMR
jgi:hypothetical protein